MVSLGSSDSTIRMLIERLNWPVRLARWRAAREYGQLFSSNEYSEHACNIYLNWLSSRHLESEVVSGLAVLFCTSDDDLPPFQAVAANISRPSVLADMMLQFVYGQGKVNGGWENAHSGEVPASFAPDKFFTDHKSSHVPPFLGSELEELERAFGFPFTRQWAFEWRALMDATNAPHSGYPYYFVSSLLQRSGVSGQFSQRQCDVYRSAFLRTLACAVSHWGMPLNKAARTSLDTLPVNLNLVNIEPIQRPLWLSDVPERCSDPGAPLEPLVRSIVKPGMGSVHMRPIALRVPISVEVAEFADISITAILATSDFAPNLDHAQSITRELLWELPDHVSFDGAMDKVEFAEFFSRGRSGACAPLCGDVHPLPHGFWHNDYFQVGMPLPASFVFEHQPVIACHKNHIAIMSNGRVAGSLCMWHDHWTPLYANDGATRCGFLTELHEDEIAKAKKRHGLQLGWFVDMRIWKQKSEYGAFELSQRREYFHD